jgi:nucleoid DNA-binding protein
MGRNPGTGEAIQIKASKKGRIQGGEGFKNGGLTPQSTLCPVNEN